MKRVGTRTVHANLVGCRWSEWLSEENGGSANFGADVISGLECAGSNCDNKSFFVCSVTDPARRVSDPDEAGVANSRDFRAAATTFAGADLVTSIDFYANYEGHSFFYYIDMDSTAGADFLVSCSSSRFRVLRKSPTRLGVYDILVHEGRPAVSGRRYGVEFPLSVLGRLLNSSFTFWLYSMTSRDRMPDVGSGVVVTE